MLEESIKDNVPFGFTLRCILREDRQINRVAWSPNGQILAATSGSDAIQLWNIDTGKMVHTFKEGFNYSIAWSPNGQILASGSVFSLLLWDIRTGTCLKIKTPTRSNVCVAWSPDGMTLAASSEDGIIRLWNLDSEKIRLELQGHTRGINGVAWSPDGRILASASDDNMVCFLNPLTGQCVARFSEHTSSVNSVAWSPDGRLLASASNDNTIRIWSFVEKRPLITIEGHTGPVVSVAFSFDGRLLASKSLDGTVRCWRVDTGAGVATLDEPSLPYGWYSSLAFHPNMPFLATLGEEDTIIRVWMLDSDSLLGSSSSVSTTYYRNAKVVLVGDRAVGKSSLSLVLTEHPFAPLESTHGRQVRYFDSVETELTAGRTEIREILLWDLAGQPHYRLIHQFYLNAATVALIVFDSHSDIDPFAGVNYWERALRLAQRIQTNPISLMKRFLVAARIDQGGRSVGKNRINHLMHVLKIDEYFETSAKDGRGIGQLAMAIKHAIDWEVLPKVSSTLLFQRIKDFIVDRKEHKLKLSTIDDLYKAFQEIQPISENSKGIKAQFETCIDQLESHGIVQQLSFRKLVLLKPELLDYYASALINTVKDEPDGFGAIDEEKVLKGDFLIEEDNRLEEGQERLLLIAMVERLLRLDIALRDYIDDNTYLIFPSLSTRELINIEDLGEKWVVFNFDGPLLNIYATLAVRLAYSDFFEKKEIWKDAVTFTYTRSDFLYRTITCGLLLHNVGEGHGKLTLFFKEQINDDSAYDSYTSNTILLDVRSLFENYIYKHLQSHALPESIQKIRIFGCPECGVVFPEEAISHRKKRGFETINCSACENIVQIEDNISATHEIQILSMDNAANARSEYEAHITTRRGVSEAKIIVDKKYDVFLCYNQEDLFVVENIGKNLKNREIAPWLDVWEIPPGRSWQRALEQVIGSIQSVAVFVGKAGIGPWQGVEVEAFLREFVKRGCPVIPVLLPDAPREPDLPILLKGMTWVDFRKTIPISYLDLDQDQFFDQNSQQVVFQTEDQYVDYDPLDLLIWGITGQRVESKLLEKSIYHEKSASSTNLAPTSLYPREQDMEKDFFISYDKEDHVWAEWIAWQLEDAGYKCFIKAWDTRPGSNFVLDNHEASQQVKRFIAVLSPTYLATANLQSGWTIALAQDPTGGQGKLLPVRVQECKPEGLFKPIQYIDIVGLNEAVARDELLGGIQLGRVKPLEQPKYPGPASHALSPLPEFPGKSNILIASLGDSPAVISAMYDLLTKQEKLAIDRVVILCPEGEDVEYAYGLVQRALSELINGERLICESLPFQDADSWRHACIFLKRLYMLLRYHQEKGDTVYLSLAEGRKSMTALIAWVVPFFSCIKKLYHLIDKEEQIRRGSRYFLSVREIGILPDDKFSYVMHPPLEHLILVDIPFEKGQQLGRDIRNKLATATINVLAKGEYEAEQALIAGQMAIQGGKDPLIVRVTKEVEHQFNLLRMQDPAVARKVRNGLLKLSEMDVLLHELQQFGAELDTFSFKLGKSAKVKRLLRYFKELEVPMRPVFYTDPNDIAAYPDRQVNKVVICSLEREISGKYRSLQDVAASPEFSIKDGSDVADLIAQPEPAKSVLIVPLGKSPMVATQLYTLLEQREGRTIREVVLIYPGQSTLIHSGAEIIEDMLPKGVSCTRIPVPGHNDIDSSKACSEFQQVLEDQIERVRRKYPLCKIDLALSGGRKGMTAMTIFAAQRKNIPFVYHTLITDELLSEGIEAKTAEEIEKDTTIEKLSDTNLTEQQLKARLFLDEYRLPDEPYPYARFTLFRVPVFSANN